MKFHFFLFVTETLRNEDMMWGITGRILTKFATEWVVHLRIWEEVPGSNLDPGDGLSRLRIFVVLCSPSV